MNGQSIFESYDKIIKQDRDYILMIIIANWWTTMYTPYRNILIIWINKLTQYAGQNRLGKMTISLPKKANRNNDETIGNYTNSTWT